MIDSGDFRDFRDRELKTRILGELPETVSKHKKLSLLTAEVQVINIHVNIEQFSIEC